MNAQAELLLREMVARGKKIDDYHSYDIDKGKEVKAALRLFHPEGKGWRAAS